MQCQVLVLNIVALKVSFADSKEICSYLTDRTDERMTYSVVDPVSVDASRQYKDAKIIPGCMMWHMFVYSPHLSNVGRIFV